MHDIRLKNKHFFFFFYFVESVTYRYNKKMSEVYINEVDLIEDVIRW